MKKIIVNDGCIGCGACVGIDPEHFEFNDEGLSQVINQDNLESENLQNAMEACPVSVIYVEENEECECDECDCDDCNCDDCNCDECDCEDCECEECNCDDCNCGCDC